jgi:hypothetical protein
VETGARILSEVDIAIHLASCGVPRDEMDRVLDLVRETGNDHRLKSHGEKLPDELRTLIFHETTAAEIDSYEPMVVPGSRPRTTRVPCSTRAACMPATVPSSGCEPAWTGKAC